MVQDKAEMVQDKAEMVQDKAEMVQDGRTVPCVRVSGYRALEFQGTVR